MAVGVGGEIKPETLERMVDICDLVLVDIQALIREFDEDGTVKLMGLDESGFFPLVAETWVLEGFRRRGCVYGCGGDEENVLCGGDAWERRVQRVLERWGIGNQAF